MATNVGFGSKLSDAQAEPVEAARPFLFKSQRSASPSTPLKEQRMVFGSRNSRLPITMALGIFYKRNKIYESMVQRQIQE